jgi:DHA1 family bicyclomycin/chloramphenicol resistance-like MFS transporter
MVLSRAIVSDKCDPVASAKVFSQLMLVMGLAPILAPMLGAVLVNLAGWQSIFLALSLFSAGCLLAVARPAGKPACAYAAPAAVWRLRQYLRCWLTGFPRPCLDRWYRHCRHVAYIAGSPFVFIKLYGVPPSITAGCSAPMPRASFWWPRSTPACWPSAGRPSCWPARCGCTWLRAWCCWAWRLRPAQLWPLLVPLFICIASLGCIIPNASACAMSGQGARPAAPRR